VPERPFLDVVFFCIVLRTHAFDRLDFLTSDGKNTSATDLCFRLVSPSSYKLLVLVPLSSTLTSSW